MGGLLNRQVKEFMQTVNKLLLPLLFIPFACSQAKAMSTDEAHQLVDSVFVATKKQPFPDLGEPKTIEYLHSLDEFKQLSNKAEEVWLAASQNVNLVAPTEETKDILFDSFEGLSPESYLQYINRALDYYQSHIIDKYAFEGFVLLPHGEKQFFLSYNYQDPRVRAFLLRVKAAFAVDPNIVSCVDDILSGQAKNVNEERRAEDARYLGTLPIPLLKGVVSSGAESTPSSTQPIINGKMAQFSQPETTSQQTSMTAKTGFSWLWLPAIIIVLGGIGYFVLWRRNTR